MPRCVALALMGAVGCGDLGADGDGEMGADDEAGETGESGATGSDDEAGTEDGGSQPGDPTLATFGCELVGSHDIVVDELVTGFDQGMRRIIGVDAHGGVYLHDQSPWYPSVARFDAEGGLGWTLDLGAFDPDLFGAGLELWAARGAEGPVYLLTQPTGSEARLHALDPDSGEPLWTAQLLDFFPAKQALAVTPEGDVVVFGADLAKTTEAVTSYVVVELSSGDGAELWRFDAPLANVGGPPETVGVSPHGEVFFAIDINDGGGLVAGRLDSAGELLATLSVDDYIQNADARARFDGYGRLILDFASGAVDLAVRYGLEFEALDEFSAVSYNLGARMEVHGAGGDELLMLQADPPTPATESSFDVAVAVPGQEERCRVRETWPLLEGEGSSSEARLGEAAWTVDGEFVVALYAGVETNVDRIHVFRTR